MLVLNRKPGERIIIGPNIVVTVVEVQGERVKLGFQAPGELPIYREEVLKRMEPTIGSPNRHHFGSPYYAECA